MGKIMKNGVAYSSGSNGGSNASDIAYDSSNIISAPTVEGTQDNAATAISAANSNLSSLSAGLGTASTYGVANNLTQAAAGSAVLDAYQGKLLGDRMTTAEGDIDTLNDGYTNLLNNKSNKVVVAHFSASGLSISSGSTASYVLSGTIPDGYTTLMFGPITTGGFVGTGYISGYRGNDINVWLHAFSGASSGSIGADVLCIKQ